MENKIVKRRISISSRNSQNSLQIIPHSFRSKGFVAPKSEPSNSQKPRQKSQKQHQKPKMSVQKRNFQKLKFCFVKKVCSLAKQTLKLHKIRILKKDSKSLVLNLVLLFLGFGLKVIKIKRKKKPFVKSKFQIINLNSLKKAKT